jgi:DNA repair exonuclease SbcCD ATPase subunit
LENRLTILTNKEIAIQTDKQLLQEKIGKAEDLQIQLDEMIDRFDEEELEDKIGLLKICRNDFNTSKHELEKLDIKINSLKDKQSHLESHKYNPNCEICMENSETILESKKEVEEQLSIILEKWGDEIRLNELAEEKINEYSVYESDWNTLLDIKDKEGKVDRELTNLSGRLSALETDEVRVETQIAQQKQLIEEYNQNEEQIKKNTEIRSEIKEVRDKIEITKKNLKDVNSKVLSLNGKISALENQKKSIEDRITEVKEMEEQSKLYEYYLNALSKDGVSYELIEKALPMIEGEVNNILAQIVEFGMQLEMDGKNINAFLVYGDNKWSLEMCSGMERFISGLAIRVALINICNLPRPNFLVIDEGFGTLDSENLQSLFMLFTYLKTQFDFVMIISHIDSMRDVVDGLIEIKKVDGFSNVKY